MNNQDMSDYIDCVASKTLSDVEINRLSSNQHELNGVTQLKDVFGSDSSVKKTFRTTFVHLSDEESECFSKTGSMTWYDARANHPTRSEFRLYYDDDSIFKISRPGDQLFIVKKSDGSFLSITCPKDSGIYNQITWLFNLKDHEHKFDIQTIQKGNWLNYSSKFILDLLGVSVLPTLDDEITTLLNKYSDFPSSAEFSKFARSFVDIDPINRPDEALLGWMEKEDVFFKKLEQHNIMNIIESIIIDKENGISGSELTENFIVKSLSVHNRRKSRAGLSFEHHISALFDAHKILYSRGPVTERGNKPDFIFPSIDYYRDSSINPMYLTMLGAKTTCKDRWRQVIKEADRIELKHLITVEPAISRNQLNQMREESVQLVAPKQIIGTYPVEEACSVMCVSDFISHLKGNQAILLGDTIE